jgi:signal peptidase II
MVVRTRSQSRVGSSGETPPAKSARVGSPKKKSSSSITTDDRWPMKWFFYGLLTLLIEFGLKYSAWIHRVYVEILDVPRIVKFNIVYVENRHSAFGMMRHVPDWLNHSLLAFSVIVLGVITWQQVVSNDSSTVARRGIFCFIIGAIGNMVDRLTVGAVIDYIQFELADWGSGYTLAWNISDLVINVGFAHILWEIVVEEPKRAKEAKDAEAKKSK